MIDFTNGETLADNNHGIHAADDNCPTRSCDAHHSNHSLGAGELATKIAPYVVACAKGAAIGAIGGPEAAAISCGVSVISRAAEASHNPNYMRAAFLLNVADALATGNAIRVAQKNPALPFQKWQTFIRQLKVALRR